MWQSTLSILLGSILLGYIIGIVINHLADALPYENSLITARCKYCGSPRGIRSYMPWPARCSQCGRTNTRHHLVMVFAVAGMIIIWNTNVITLNPFLTTLLYAYFVLVVVIDVEHRLILHVTSGFGLILGVITGLHMGHTWTSTLFGFLTGLGVMLLLYIFGILFVKIVNRRRDEKIDEVALGFGDVTLSAVIGAILGWPGIWAGLFLAILIGGMVSLVYIVFMWLNNRNVLNTVLPYGPYLIIATIVLLVIREFG